MVKRARSVTLRQFKAKVSAARKKQSAHQKKADKLGEKIHSLQMKRDSEVFKFRALDDVIRDVQQEITRLQSK